MNEREENGKQGRHPTGRCTSARACPDTHIHEVSPFHRKVGLSHDSDGLADLDLNVGRPRELDHDLYDPSLQGGPVAFGDRKGSRVLFVLRPSYEMEARMSLSIW